MDFNAEGCTNVIRTMYEQESYEMNKCLSLVHLTTELPCEKTTDLRFFGAAAET